MKKVVALIIVCAGAAVKAETFMVAVLPDTQMYSMRFPNIFQDQADWLVASRGEWNIQLVITEGDIVQQVNSHEEWQVADRVMGTLDNMIPYIMAVGNHDMGTRNLPSAYGRDTTMFNTYFPVERFSHYDWYGGHAGDDNDNSYVTFMVDDIPILVLSLEFGPSDEHLEWANGVARLHRDHFVIVVTHGYLDNDGYLNGSDPLGVNRYYLTDANDGEYIWENSVSLHPNVHMVLCGHYHSRSAAHCGNRYIGTGVHGNRVHELLSNYQSYMDGQSGFLRLMEFDTELNEVHVMTYSPWHDIWLGGNHEFELIVPLKQYRQEDEHAVNQDSIKDQPVTSRPRIMRW